DEGLVGRDGDVVDRLVVRRAPRDHAAVAAQQYELPRAGADREQRAGPRDRGGVELASLDQVARALCERGRVPHDDLVGVPRDDAVTALAERRPDQLPVAPELAGRRAAWKPPQLDRALR